MISTGRLGGFILAGSIVFAGCGTSPKTEPMTNIGLVKNRAVAQECGCVFSQSRSGELNAKYVWVEDFDGNAWINIYGKDVRLTTIDPPPIFASGPWEERSFSGTKLDAEASYKLMKDCPSNDEPCEIANIHLDAVIKPAGTARRGFEATASAAVDRHCGAS